MTPTNDSLRETVRRKYTDIARTSGSGCCAEQACCAPEYSMIGDAYDGVAGYVEEADLGLGCGLPVEHAGLEAGATVLDLGSGAGLDAFIARREVGESGHVIGVDMTAEMIARARDNARRTGYENVEFRLGEIEHLPVETASVDVVISNCVLNLVPDKPAAFAEIHRVLKPGGHFCISDVVASAELPDWVRGIADAYAGCVAGTVPKTEYLHLIRDAGFSDVQVAARRPIEVPRELLVEHLDAAQRAELERLQLALESVTVTARR